ncbi:MAG TPA: hypothetical protein PKY81_16420 [bacterium]|mgnify:CR=1 FL=1|nr:hypothetical protein [bacterium]HPN32539.1 hypothetical protein [bacterium]
MARKRFYIIVVLFAVAFVLRYYDIYKDPFYFSSGDKDAFVDPGIYSFNAKHKITNGTFFFEEYNYHLVFPLNSFFTYLFFKIAGISFVSLIKFFACLGLISSIIFSLAFKNETNFLYYAVLFSLTFIVIAVNRTGLTENYLLLWLALSLYCFKNETATHQFVCGFLIVSGILIKTNFVPATVSIIAAGFFRRKENSVFRFFIFGIVSAVLISLLYILKFYDSYALLKESVILRHIFADHSGNFYFFNAFNVLTFLSSNFFIRCFMIYGFFLAGIYKIILNRNRNSKIEILLIPVFILTVIAINLSATYSPARYRLMLIPFFIIGSISYFTISTEKKSAFLGTALSFFFVYPFAWWILKKKIQMNHSDCAVLIVSILLSVFLFYLLPKFSRFLNLKTFIVIFLAIELFQYFYSFHQTGYDLSNASKKINELIPSGKTAAGWWAPQICFDRTDIKIIPGNLYKKYYEKYNPDYLIAANEQYKTNYELLDAFKLSRPNFLISIYKNKKLTE